MPNNGNTWPLNCAAHLNVCLCALLFFFTCVLRLRVTPSSIPWASVSVSVTLLSLATPPGDITRLWDAAVCDRVVLGGRLETDRWERDRKVRGMWVYNTQFYDTVFNDSQRPVFFVANVVECIQTVFEWGALYFLPQLEFRPWDVGGNGPGHL